jgi:hypothetical protein
MALHDVKLNRIDLIFLVAGGVIFLLFVFDLAGTRILFNGDASSASFLLSTLTQSLAALFAITFSVLIIAIEFSASKYTPKVLHFLLASIFKDFQIVGIIVFFFRRDVCQLHHACPRKWGHGPQQYQSVRITQCGSDGVLLPVDPKSIPSHSAVL